MPTVVISGPAQAFAGSPRRSDPITDRRTLAQFHGLVSQQDCIETFYDSPLSAIGLTGGHLRFVLDEETPALRITTRYQVPRRLTEEEMRLLLDATRVQWSDGSGSGSFTNFSGRVLSTSLDMAVLNTDPTRAVLGAYFVDAYPLFADDGETRVAYFELEETERTDFDYLQEAACYGNAQAQFVLARQFEAGAGVDPNEQLAFENYQRAAEQGHLLALVFLGLCFQRGIGTIQDLKRGFECFARAAQGGVPLAMHCLGECYLEGRGVEPSPDEGIRWYRQGVELGDPGCTAELGNCYEFGKGVPKDLHQALALYQR
jgi:hypothetical protein